MSGMRLGSLSRGALCSSVALCWSVALSGVAEAQSKEVAKLTASDGAAGDSFGRGLSIEGDRAAIGAEGDDDLGTGSGSVYVIERGSDGVWHVVQKLVISGEPTAGDALGEYVVIAGDELFAAARGDDELGQDAGSVHVFERQPSGVWKKVQKLTASDGAAHDDFGNGIAISGDYAIVGAPHDDDFGPSSGSAYLFERQSSGLWQGVQKLTAGDGAMGDAFGTSVAISGGVAFVGAQHDGDSGPDSGSAYVFERNPGGAWREVQKLTASDASGGNIFGSSVSLSGDYAVVGSRWDAALGSGAGSAYVFGRGVTGSWHQVWKLTASDGAAGHNFGATLSLSGDRVLVGAHGSGSSSTGAAYLFERQAGGAWKELQRLSASDGASSDAFGLPVSLSGHRAIVGAIGHDALGSSSGAAYVFDEFAPVWTDLGLSLAGTYGDPVLSGAGTLAAGTAVNLTLDNVLSNTSGVLVVSDSIVAATFLGGTLVPDPASPGVVLPVPIFGPAGQPATVVLGGFMPAGVSPGTNLYFQYWIVDPAGPFGAAASNAIAGTIP